MPYEDFSTWIQAGVDAAKLVPRKNYLSTGVFDNATSTYVYEDFGVDFFSGDFTHKFHSHGVTGATVGRGTIWMISNTLDDVEAQVVADADFQYLEVYGLYSNAYRLRLGVCENGELSFDTSVNIGDGSIVYVTLSRDDDGGANGTGQLTAVIRSDSHEGSILDTLTIDCGVGEQNDFRYFYPFSTWTGGGAGTLAVSNRDCSLDDGATYELFEDYTVVEGASVINTLKDSGLNWAGLFSDEDAYNYKDFGINRINEDFSYKFQVEVIVEHNNPIMLPFILSNTLIKGSDQTDYQRFYYQNDFLYLRIEEDNSSFTDGPVALPNDGTMYYVTFDRDDDGGANGTGKITAYYRTGSHEGALVDTHTLDCGVGFQVDWEYVITPISWGAWAGANDTTGWIHRVDLGGLVPLFGGLVDLAFKAWGKITGSMTSRAHKGMGVT